MVLSSNTRVVGVNKYTLENIMSGQSRQIRVTWPGRLDNVNGVDIRPEINITRDDIYLKFKGQPAK
jgi:hypothetical protein